MVSIFDEDLDPSLLNKIDIASLVAFAKDNAILFKMGYRNQGEKRS